MDMEEITGKHWVKYGVIYPIFLIAACVLAEWLESLY